MSATSNQRIARRSVSAACLTERDDAEEANVRFYAAAGELLLADGTTYTRLATYDAPDMEEALRRAAKIVARWRVEQIAARPHATVRDIIEVQISEDHGTQSRGQTVRRISRKASSARRSHHDSRTSRAARSSSV